MTTYFNNDGCYRSVNIDGKAISAAIKNLREAKKALEIAEEAYLDIVLGKVELTETEKAMANLGINMTFNKFFPEVVELEKSKAIAKVNTARAAVARAEKQLAAVRTHTN